jgi:transcriptional regulator with XRE-family HTH domain
MQQMCAIVAIANREIRMLWHPQASTQGIVGRKAQVLSKATRNAAAELGMSQRELADVLGVSTATISRAESTGRAFNGKELELAGHFVRLYRSLDAIVGGDQRAAREWFRAHNTHLGGTPADLIQSIRGLLDVVQYLDAMRGKV